MIVVTGATGNIGKQVLASLVESGADVRVIVRDPARIPSSLREHIDIVTGSHGDPAIVDQAFAGADSVFWLLPIAPNANSLEEASVGFTRPASEALRRHGVRRVISVSALGRGTAVADHAGFVTASLAMDDLIASTGVDFRALALPSFMENLLRQIETIRSQGIIVSTLNGDRKMPTCATRDIAAAASRLLLDPEWSGQGSVPVLGPEDLSQNEIAGIVSEVLGKPVRYQQVPLDAFKARLKEFRMSEAYAEGYVEMMAAKDAGLDNGVQRTPETASPTTFRQWCEEVLKPAVLG